MLLTMRNDVRVWGDGAGTCTSKSETAISTCLHISYDAGMREKEIEERGKNEKIG